MQNLDQKGQHLLIEKLIEQGNRNVATQLMKELGRDARVSTVTKKEAAKSPPREAAQVRKRYSISMTPAIEMRDSTK